MAVYHLRRLRTVEPEIAAAFLPTGSAARVASRGRVHVLTDLPGFLVLRDADPAGLAVYRIENEECEIVFLQAVVQRIGIGVSLLRAITATARRRGCTRVWVIARNDDLAALRFYQRNGFRLAALYRGALERMENLPLPFPPSSDKRIPIRDELELEYRL